MIHIIVTLITVFTLLFIPHFYNSGFAGMPRRYFDYSNLNSGQHYFDKQFMIAGIVILFLLAQIIFIVNIIIGIFKSRKSG